MRTIIPTGFFLCLSLLSLQVFSQRFTTTIGAGLAREFWNDTVNFTKGASLNFLGVDEGSDRVRLSFGSPRDTVSLFAEHCRIPLPDKR